MRADLHGDGGQLALDGLRDGLHPASLLGLSLAAAALENAHSTMKLCTSFSLLPSFLCRSILFSEAKKGTNLQSCFHSFGVKMESSLECVITVT